MRILKRIKNNFENILLCTLIFIAIVGLLASCDRELARWGNKELCEYLGYDGVEIKTVKPPFGYKIFCIKEISLEEIVDTDEE